MHERCAVYIGPFGLKQASGALRLRVPRRGSRADRRTLPTWWLDASLVEKQVDTYVYTWNHVYTYVCVAVRRVTCCRHLPCRLFFIVVFHLCVSPPTVTTPVVTEPRCCRQRCRNRSGVARHAHTQERSRNRFSPFADSSIPVC